MVNKRIMFFLIITIIVIGLLGAGYVFREKIKKRYTLLFFEPKIYSNSQYSRELNYRLFTPKTNESVKYPLIVYLHSFGYNGSDNRLQVNSFASIWAQRNVQSKHPSFVIVPQCPIGKLWAYKDPMGIPFKHYIQDNNEETEEMKMIVEVIKESIDNYPIDDKRVYMVGFSMGATGCWDILTRHPQLFAASVVASGNSDPTKANTIIDIPIWAFSGENDSIAPAQLNKNMVEAINQHGGNAKINILKEEGHDIAHIAFKYPEVLDWLFNQKKRR